MSESESHKPTFGEQIVERVPLVSKKRKRILKPLPVTQETRKTPAPREMRIIQALATGEAKTTSEAMRMAGFHPSSKQVRQRLEPGGDLRLELAALLHNIGLTPECVAKGVKDNIDAKKTVFVGQVAHSIEDNDARARARDQAIKLLDRAGQLPAETQVESNQSITVNILQIDTKQS